MDLKITAVLAFIAGGMSGLSALWAARYLRNRKQGSASDISRVRENFPAIPVDGLEEEAHDSNLAVLTEKIRQFKMRNAYYRDDDFEA